MVLLHAEHRPVVPNNLQEIIHMSIRVSRYSKGIHDKFKENYNTKNPNHYLLHTKKLT